MRPKNISWRLLTIWFVYIRDVHVDNRIEKGKERGCYFLYSEGLQYNRRTRFLKSCNTLLKSRPVSKDDSGASFGYLWSCSSVTNPATFLFLQPSEMDLTYSKLDFRIIMELVDRGVIIFSGKVKPGKRKQNPKRQKVLGAGFNLHEPDEGHGTKLFNMTAYWSWFCTLLGIFSLSKCFCLFSVAVVYMSNLIIFGEAEPTNELPTKQINEKLWWV